MDDPSTAGYRPSPPPPDRKRRGKGILWALIAVVLAFLIGFFWQWYEAQTVRDTLARTEQELRVERYRVQLARAAMSAQSGDFESARTEMSAFFTRLQDQRETLPDSLRVVADAILGQRDQVITGLSRSNPEYVGVLYHMLGRFMPGAAGAAPATRDTTPRPPTAGEASDTAAPSDSAGEQPEPGMR